VTNAPRPDTVFGRILRGELPAKFLHQDERCVVIADIHPQAPFHVLVIPRKPIVSLGDAGPEDDALLGHCLSVARDDATGHGHGRAFRVVTNSGAGAGQSVPHLHFHVLAGRPLASAFA
jgi:histidine triad (HIT) family protein